MIILKVRKQKTGPVINRHPWVFSQALETIPDNLKPGVPVKLAGPDAGRDLGRLRRVPVGDGSGRADRGPGRAAGLRGPNGGGRCQG